MPNSRERELQRKALRHYSPEDEDWVAPSPEEGGPAWHNAATYSNWWCRCRDCKADHNHKQRIFQEEQSKGNRSPSSELASEQPSSDAPSDGGGVGEKV